MTKKEITGEVIKAESAGRPCLYKPEMCEKLIKYMSEGKTDTQTCALLGISPDSLANYRRRFPEMAECYAQGKLLQQAYWEDIAMQGITGQIKGFNATMAIFMMSNLYRKDYQQKNDGHNVQVNVNSPSLLSDDELQERLKQLKHLTET